MEEQVSDYIVFCGGVSGVFIGMALIYISIKITAAVIGKLPEKAAQEKK